MIDGSTAMDPKIHDPSSFTYCRNAPSMFFETPLITFRVKQGVAGSPSAAAKTG